MFIRNRSTFSVALARGNLAGNIAVGAVSLRTEHRVIGARLLPCEEPLPSHPTDPPDPSRIALWFGASVTAAGEVYGPTAAPFARWATFTVGSAVARLRVSGERRWRRTILSELAASDPLPFERITLSFTRAFGGSIDVPPGLFPGTDLPFPGGRLGYATNPDGIGFHLDQAAAAGSLLPSFELANQLISKWDDRPEPGGFSSCPELPGLRLSPPRPSARITKPPEPQVGVGGAEDLDHAITQGFRALHHAPGYLLFDELKPGTPIQLEGVGRRTIRFEAPAPPARVAVHRGRRTDDALPELRSVHVNAEQETVSCHYGYMFRYNQDQAPSWISVEPLS